MHAFQCITVKGEDLLVRCLCVMHTDTAYVSVKIHACLDKIAMLQSFYSMGYMVKQKCFWFVHKSDISHSAAFYG